MQSAQRRAVARPPPDPLLASRQSGVGLSKTKAASLCLLLLVEMPQIGRRLSLPERHQQAVAAQHVLLAADADMDIALGADRLHPDRLALATHGLENRPRPGEGVIGHGDLVVE